MTMTILFVDDELPLQRVINLKFKKKIRAKEWEFIFAQNGVEALAKIREYPQISMVITDINMPEMDGLTLLGELPSIDSNLKAIVLSAYSDMRNIRTAMNLGAFDFVTKPIDFQDLEVTINRTLEYVEQIQENQKKLQHTQAQLISSEKMATLGQLVAGVAHEINNPLTFIVGNLDLAEEYVTDLIHHLQLYQTQFEHPGATIKENEAAIDINFLLEDLPQIMIIMREGTELISQISTSLRVLARSDTQVRVAFNIHEGIDSSLMILKHRLKANEQHPDIEVIKEYGELPLVKCYPGQLNQVFMNLIANAIDALEESNKGYSFVELRSNPNKITISTEVLENNSGVVIRIKDNGVGMSTELQQQVFQPFFTTKAVGKGTGLGLSITRQLVEENHRGKLRCISSPGMGTEFVVEIPIDRRKNE
ncbi:MAG: response regulator [Symploca sp. SIO2G7]|nr:response regulator [Symploca sp. SIO2G7]